MPGQPTPIMPITASKPKRGRPRSENPRSTGLLLRLNRHEAAIIENKAKLAGKVRADWIRQTLLTA